MMRFIFLFSCLLLTACTSSLPSQNDDTTATLWYRYAGESRALQYQAFNLAKLRLDAALKQPRGKLPPAIIVDIDETLIDNSPNAARDILAARPYSPANWTKWVKEERATALTGAVDFLRYTHQRGVAIFYISNRNAGQELLPTYHNLRKLGFPVQYSHLLFKTDTSGKQARRDKVARKHQILLLMGDNLSDFAPQFDKKSPAERNYWVDRYRNRFGYDFIVLPNPVYGDWEAALYHHSKPLTEEQKYRIRRDYLEKIAR